VTTNGSIVRNALRIAVSVVMLLLYSSCGVGDEISSELEVSHARSLLFPGGDAYAANEHLIEEEIQLCMQAGGFEYIPRVYEVSERSQLPFPTIGTWTVEMAERFGFSIAQRATPHVIPSRDLVQALSEAERQAWIEATSECRIRVVEQVNGQWELSVGPIRQDFDDLVAEFNADPASVRLELAWSDCMRSRGYQDELSSFQQFAQGYADRFNEHQLRVGASERSPEQEFELDELIQKEIQGAVDTAQCAESLRAMYTELWNDYQADFLNGTQIAALPGTES